MKRKERIVAVEKDITATISDNYQGGYAADFLAKLRPGQDRAHEMLYEILEIIDRIEKRLVAYSSEDLKPRE